MSGYGPAALASVDAAIDVAARGRSDIGVGVVAEMATACAIDAAGARARLFIAHLQDADERSSVALCTAVVEKQAKLAFFCHALLNHAPATLRTARTFVGVMKLAMPTHPAARLNLSMPLQVCPLYDAMWSEMDLVALAPRSEGYGETFRGVLVHSLQPLVHHTAFTVARREGDRVFLSLKNRSALVTDEFWVAPPCLMISGTLEPPKGYLLVLSARLRRGVRRLRKRLGR